MVNSPVKKLNFDVADKENVPIDAPVVVKGLEPTKPIVQEIKKDEKPVAAIVAPTIKEEEAHEPLLQENPHRFVLFPIKYQEVRVNSRTRLALSVFGNT